MVVASSPHHNGPASRRIKYISIYLTSAGPVIEVHGHGHPLQMSDIFEKIPADDIPRFRWIPAHINGSLIIHKIAGFADVIVLYELIIAMQAAGCLRTGS